MVKKFNRDYLLEELDLPYKAIQTKMIDRSRWAICYEMIFEDNGKYYKTYYWDGATEMQDSEDPFNYMEEIECEEVEKRIIQVEAWMPVEDNNG